MHLFCNAAILSHCRVWTCWNCLTVVSSRSSWCPECVSGVGRAGVQLWTTSLLFSVGNLSQADEETFWALVGNPRYSLRTGNNLEFFAWKDIILLLYMCFRGVFRFLGLWSCFTGLLVGGFFKVIFCSFALFQSGNVFLGLEVLEKRVPGSFAPVVVTVIYF